MTTTRSKPCFEIKTLLLFILGRFTFTLYHSDVSNAKGLKGNSLPIFALSNKSQAVSLCIKKSHLGKPSKANTGPVCCVQSHTILSHLQVIPKQREQQLYAHKECKHTFSELPTDTILVITAARSTFRNGASLLKRL